jgi:hypothetical protein
MLLSITNTTGNIAGTITPNAVEIKMVLHEILTPVPDTDNDVKSFCNSIT